MAYEIWSSQLQRFEFVDRKGMVKGFPLIEKLDLQCERCILGKQHRESFPAGKSIREKTPFDIVHLYLCGQMQTPSIGRNYYILTFIDDCTRRTWVYFIKQKSEVFERFHHYKYLVEKQSGHYVKVLSTDTGGEFISSDFLLFSREHGIHEKFTKRYTPQQNGVAERNNRTIIEIERGMLKEKKFPNDYCADPVTCAAYIIINVKPKV